MIWRSKDRRSAGLWWSLLSSGGCLGGYGRLHKPFQPLIVAFVSAGDAVDHSVTKRHGRFLALFGPYIILSSSAAVGAAAAADRSVTEFAMDRWVIRRGPLGNSPWTTGQRGGPASFLFSGLP
uniref:Uncharacterized protein n=1 Tax=Fagus sylvatica TaxID=28930 RepID=A0A2N9IW16_FAGSY